MSVYVLVSGGWLGGWCWQRVAPRLREEGHNVYPATLTGLGERVHLASPEVDLETHITDVVNLIEFEDLHEVRALGAQLRRSCGYGRGRPGARSHLPASVPGHRSAPRRHRPHRDVSARSQEAHRAAGGGSRRWVAVPHAATRRAGRLR